MLKFSLKLVAIMVILCFEYVWMVEWIDVTIRIIKYFTVAIYNKYSTKIIKKIEEKTVIPYKENNQIPADEMVDISNLLDVVPKIVINIDIMTGKIYRKMYGRIEEFLKNFFIHGAMERRRQSK